MYHTVTHPIVCNGMYGMYGACMRPCVRASVRACIRVQIIELVIMGGNDEDSQAAAHYIALALPWLDFEEMDFEFNEMVGFRIIHDIFYYFEVLPYYM